MFNSPVTKILQNLIFRQSTVHRENESSGKIKIIFFVAKICSILTSVNSDEQPPSFRKGIIGILRIG